MRLKLLSPFSFVIFASILFVTDARTEEPGDSCDHFAAAPTDINRAAAGIAFDDLDPAAAIPACEQAVRSFPTVLRFKFQLARALDKGTRTAEAAALYESLSVGGYAAAAYNLSLLYFSGEGFIQDTRLATEFLQRAAELGHPRAEYELGWSYANGNGVDANPTAAAEWYAKSAALGYAPAQNNLGAMYQNGIAFAQDDAKAVELYKKSAAQGYNVAQANLGWMYEKGRGVLQDPTEAAKWYAAAVNAGNASAQYALASLYESGRGVPHDDAKALELYKQSAAQGIVIALTNVGRMYASGHGVPQNFSEAANWFAIAAERGDAWAQSALGSFYLNGTGVAKNYGKALELFARASASGDASAEANIGFIYLNGFGTPIDYGEAEKHLRTAARNKNSFAMVLLAWMYTQGKGVALDSVKAYIWYRLALNAGDQSSHLALAKLCLTIWTTSAELSRAVEAGRAEADSALTPSDPQADTSRARLPGYIDENLRQQILAFRVKSIQADLLDQERDRIINQYALAYVISRDPLFSQNVELAKAALVRTRGKDLVEAAGWYGKAIDTGAIDGLLGLADLYLAEDRGSQRSFSASTGIFWFNNLVEPDFPQFVGSAERAAQLYQDAIAKGSNAARINLAVLYEAGFGVTKNLDKALSLYRQAIGSTFDAKAWLGYLRITLNSYWDRELLRAQALVLSEPQSRDEEKKDDDIIIRALNGYQYIDIRDAIGSRIFNENLPAGQEYVVPRDRDDLYLWISRYDESKLEVRIGRNVVHVTSPETYYYAVRLNRALLQSGGDYLVRRSDDDEPRDLPEETIAKSRITVEGLSDGKIYIHSADQIIGFEESLPAGSRFRVPPISGLTLELRPPQANDSSAIVAISVDGKRILTLETPTGCLVTLSLDPDRLHDLMTSTPQSCDPRIDEALPVTYVTDSASTPIGFMKKLPNENFYKDPRGTVPLIAADLVPGVKESALSSLQLAGRWDEALHASQIFLEQDLRRFGPYSFKTISTLLSLCNSEIREGETVSARDHLDQAIELLERLDHVPQQVRATFFRNFGWLLSRLGRYPEAERFILMANRFVREANDSTRKQSENGIDYDTLSNLREVLGDLDAALAYQFRSILLDSLASPEDAEGENQQIGPDHWIRLIDLLKKTDRGEWIERFLDFVHLQAKQNVLPNATEPLTFPLDLSIFENVFGPVDRANNIATFLGDLGQAYSWMGRHREALPLLEQLAKTQKNTFGQSNPQATIALANFANELRLVGVEDEALLKAREALSFALEFSYRSGLSAMATAESVNIPAMALLKAAYSKDKDALAYEAFEVAQRVQGSAAAMALQALGARLEQDDSAVGEFVRRRQDLRQRRTRLDADLLSVISGDPQLRDRQRESEIRQEISSTDVALRNVDSARPSRLVEFDELGRPSPVQYPEIQSLLTQDEALISVSVGADVTYVFAATSETLRWTQVDVGAYTLGRIINTLRCGLDWEHSNDIQCEELKGTIANARMRDFDPVLSYRLYRQLFSAIDDLILSKSRLNFVLSGALTSFPPGVFVVTDPVGKDLKDVDWLIRRHALTILPSIASLRTLRAHTAASKARKPLVGFADPVFDWRRPQRVAANGLVMRGASDRVADVRNFREALDPLPKTAAELEGVAASVFADKSALFFGSDATETRVKQSNLEDYRIVYFATHALVADEVARLAKLDPEPALVLSLPEHPTAIDDGLLTASEAAQLKLDADWVVLSACNTASGSAPGAEPLSGLASAFFYAGARSLLVSHWEAEENSSAQLMIETFAALAAERELSHGEALQRAMLNMIDHPTDPHWVDPKYWAPFVVVGEPAKAATSH